MFLSTRLALWLLCVFIFSAHCRFSVRNLTESSTEVWFNNRNATKSMPYWTYPLIFVSVMYQTETEKNRGRRVWIQLWRGVRTEDGMARPRCSLLSVPNTQQMCGASGGTGADGGALWRGPCREAPLTAGLLGACQQNITSALGPQLHHNQDAPKYFHLLWALRCGFRLMGPTDTPVEGKRERVRKGKDCKRYQMWAEQLQSVSLVAYNE